MIGEYPTAHTIGAQRAGNSETRPDNQSRDQVPVPLVRTSDALYHRGSGFRSEIRTVTISDAFKRSFRAGNISALATETG